MGDQRTPRPHRTSSHSMYRLFLIALIVLSSTVAAKKCDPKAFVKKENPESTTSYLYCNSDGTLAQRDCPAGKMFNPETSECMLPPELPTTKPPPMPVQRDDPFLEPQFQAPDDICSGGAPLTKLGAPVACNPQIASCPDGYSCVLYSRTGSSYCCQMQIDPTPTGTDTVLCAANQVTYIEPLTAVPKSCALASPGSCPTGFGCNLVAGALTRCCGKDFGCPKNSAGFVNPNTGSHVQCNIADPNSCPNGFVCTRSSMFNTGICCSDTSTSRNDVCGGETPLSTPNPCSASAPCPAGYACRNGRCCPAKGMCPAGMPLGGVTACSAANPCPNNYQCVTNNGAQYCCPAAEHVCGQPRDSGRPCEASNVPAIQRYYFDTATGSCRSFAYSQCGGNANNFDSLEQCEGFCLESQCPTGGGLRAGPTIASCAPGASPNAESACPSRFNCVQPLFGANFICCSQKESVCRDSPTAGNACFGPHMTVQRFRYNPDRGQCEPFQYYGCGGSSNNFVTKAECAAACQTTAQMACNGVAPMSGEDGVVVKRCAATVPCPRGSWCNTRGYCCPHAETSCTAPKSIGHTCLSEKPGTYWYYDAAAEVCLPFVYSGCGGTPNRFTDRNACEQQCIAKLGDCPRGMAPFLTPTGAQRCSPHSPSSCPEGTSCVRSSTGEEICCSSTAQCPISRLPYIIPGSDSHVACLPDDDNCPQGFQCVQSSTVAGFYMCCSAGGRKMGAMHILRAVQQQQSIQHMPPAKCPNGLASNGQRCAVNEIESCPSGYVCVGGGVRGVCCKAQPKCQKKRRPFYIAKKQVITCTDDSDVCPRGAQCTPSTVEGIDICCSRPAAPTTQYAKVPKVVPKCKDGALPFFALGSRIPQQCSTEQDEECPEEYECDMASDDQYYCCPAWDRCPADSTPFIVEGSRKPLGCNWMANNCPEGYSCEGSKDRAICCKSRPSSAQCPTGQSPFLYAKRPLVCPPGKKTCPIGYECVAAKNGGVNVCCSAVEHQTPECVNGYGYYDPTTNKNQMCDPTMSNCPPGYSCKRSTVANAHVCCTTQQDPRLEGYCPPGHVPLTHAASIEPPTCHMALSPCPTTAAYQCIYSADKQNSYCCAPVDTAARFGSTNAIGFRHFHHQKAFRELAATTLDPMAETETTPKPLLLIGVPSMAAQPTAPANSGFSAPHLQIVTVPQSPGASFQMPNPQMSVQQMGQQMGQQLNQMQYGAQPAAATAPPPPQLPNAAHIIASCPPWSKPLLNMQTRSAQSCSTWNRCPSGFTCYSNYPDGREAQCCTTVPLDNQVVFRANPQLVANAAATPSPAAAAQPQFQFSPPSESAANPDSTGPVAADPSIAQHSPPRNLSAVVVPALALPSNVTLLRCPVGTVNISGSCKRMFFAGQQGCESDAQCSERTNGTLCQKGYCQCADSRLIHESQCVPHCPEGFLNIASRCHDLTTVVFMDSVDERANGTIGGFCLDTVVREEQCSVPNAYCNERSVTCQCRPGFELRMDFENKDDKGSCVAVEGSKFVAGAPQTPLADEAAEQAPAAPPTFYVIDAQSDAALDEASGAEPIDLGAALNDTSIHVRGVPDENGAAVEILTKRA